MPTGCRFHPRCPYATDHCQQKLPDLTAVKIPPEQNSRLCRCWRQDEISLKGLA
jgi:peptide/nickel transport system ATP-binding protein